MTTSTRATAPNRTEHPAAPATTPGALPRRAAVLAVAATALGSYAWLLVAVTQRYELSPVAPTSAVRSAHPPVSDLTGTWRTVPVELHNPTSLPVVLEAVELRIVSSDRAGCTDADVQLAPSEEAFTLPAGARHHARPAVRLQPHSAARCAHARWNVQVEPIAYRVASAANQPRPSETRRQR